MRTRNVILTNKRMVLRPVNDGDIMNSQAVRPSPRNDGSEGNIGQMASMPDSRKPIDSQWMGPEIHSCSGYNMGCWINRYQLYTDFLGQWKIPWPVIFIFTWTCRGFHGFWLVLTLMVVVNSSWRGAKLRTELQELLLQGRFRLNSPLQVSDFAGSWPLQCS